MPRSPTTGLVYVIASCDGTRPFTEARAISGRLRAAARITSTVIERELPGILWGFCPVPPREESEGDRLTHAERGSVAGVLRGDPVWLEPLSGEPCTAEKLLEIWSRRGVETAPQLDNISLALVADSGTGAVNLVTDRMGGISCYSAVVDGHRVLSTSYIALSRIVKDRSIDGESIASFFHLGYFPGRRTALKAISLIPFASVTTLKAGKMESRPYWLPEMTVDCQTRIDSQLDLGVEAFNTTVREYSAGRAPVFLAMTAGLDSRTVAASLLSQQIPFRAYTHGFPDCWEGRRVSSIVKRHRIPHQFVPLVKSFTDRLEERALESFRWSEGTISCIEKSHLVHVQSLLRAEAGPAASLLLGGGAGMLKGTFYRLIRDEPGYSQAGIDAYLSWNFTKKLPDIFASEVPATSREPLRNFVVASLDEAAGGSFFQRLDYLYAVRYRRWAGGVKHIYRQFFPVREPFVSARLLDYLFRIDPRAKKAELPHLRILERDFPALQYDLSNKMTPALPFNWRTAHRFLPSMGWRAKQLLRGFSRRFLPKELFPLVDYVDYKRWIALASGRSLVNGLLDPGIMRSAQLYDPTKLTPWLESQRAQGYPTFPLIDKMCTLELYFREIAST